MAKRRESPIPRINPSGEKAWVGRATDPQGKRHHRGTLKLKREAQDAIDTAYEEWENGPTLRETVGQYAADWTERHPRSERTNYDRNSKLRQVLDVKIEGRRLHDWPFAQLHRSHARDLQDRMLRHQGRAAAGAAAVLRVLSAMAEDASDDRCATVNPFKGVRLRAGDPRVTKPARETRIWTMDQMHEFAAAGARNEAMIRMLSDCGMRVGEMLALRWALQDLNLAAALPPCETTGGLGLRPKTALVPSLARRLPPTNTEAVAGRVDAARLPAHDRDLIMAVKRRRPLSQPFLELVRPIADLTTRELDRRQGPAPGPAKHRRRADVQELRHGPSPNAGER